MMKLFVQFIPHIFLKTFEWQVTNPVPRVSHPEWLWKKIREKDDKYRQRNILDMFGPKQKRRDSLPSSGNETAKKDSNLNPQPILDTDMEDFGSNKENLSRAGPRAVVKTYQCHKASTESPSRQGLKPLLANSTHGTKSKVGILTESRHQNGAVGKSEEKCEDYGLWLEQKKRKWKEMRERRKRQR